MVGKNAVNTVKSGLSNIEAVNNINLALADAKELGNVNHIAVLEEMLKEAKEERWDIVLSLASSVTGIMNVIDNSLTKSSKFKITGSEKQDKELDDKLNPFVAVTNTENNAHSGVGSKLLSGAAKSTYDISQDGIETITRTPREIREGKSGEKFPDSIDNITISAAKTSVQKDSATALNLI